MIQYYTKKYVFFSSNPVPKNYSNANMGPCLVLSVTCFDNNCRVSVSVFSHLKKISSIKSMEDSRGILGFLYSFSHSSNFQDKISRWMEMYSSKLAILFSFLIKIQSRRVFFFICLSGNGD